MSETFSSIGFDEPEQVSGREGLHQLHGAGMSHAVVHRRATYSWREIPTWAT